MPQRALGGGERECVNIDREYFACIVEYSKSYRSWWKFRSVESFFMDHGMESFISIVCIGRGIWVPRYTSVNSIQHMAQVRSDAAVQWILFLQLFVMLTSTR